MEALGPIKDDDATFSSRIAPILAILATSPIAALQTDIRISKLTYKAHHTTMPSVFSVRVYLRFSGLSSTTTSDV
jgi:hypothetical protein